MNTKAAICPACGSGQVVRHEDNDLGYITLGYQFSYKNIYYSCGSCHEEGDIFGETDKGYQIAQKNAQEHLVRDIIENMAKAGISMAMFERAFELPARTLTRWKEGNFSTSALSLLNVITTYPWIINVAEQKFEPANAKYELIKAAAKDLVREAQMAALTHEPFQQNSGAFVLYIAHSNNTRVSPSITVTSL